MADQIRWAYNKADQSPGLLLWQVYQKWSREVAAILKPHGLTHMQFVLLTSTAWHNNNGMSPTQKELALFCNVDINMTSQVLRALEKRGFIKRNQVYDERSKCLQITEKGSHLATEAMPVVEKLDAQFFNVPGFELKQVPKLLSKLFEQKVD